MKLPHFFPQKRRQAMTLIELLVAFVVLAVLAVLALTGIQHATRAADRAACVGNLRQIGAAIFQYVADNRGILPGPAWGGQMPVVRGSRLLPKTQEALCDYLAPYLAVPPLAPTETAFCRVFECPAGRKSMGAARLAATPYPSYYMHITRWVSAGVSERPFGYGYAAQETPAIPVMRYLELKEPHRSIALFDHDKVFQASATTTPEKVAHGNTRSVLYLDGRVESVNVDRFILRNNNSQLEIVP